MKKYLWVAFAVICLTWLSCDTLKSIENSINTPAPLSETEIVNGLKQALEVGTGNAVGILNKTDGYFGDALVKILFPSEAQRAADKLRQLGMGKLVDDFVMTMNRAAEKAAAEAKPIFVDAVKQMTFTDARNILQGPDNAATEYFKGKTTPALTSKFTPVISNALNSCNATKYWTDITSTYNKIPLVTKVETDLVKYTTGKALDGLFLKLAGEEKKIRTNPAARVTELLQKVFGSVKK
ncbi:MAG: DUF4197 domain-containing protein [Bacteroidia bacterium]